jgi:hypothetical protein
MTSPTHRPDPSATRPARVADALISSYVRELLSEDDAAPRAAEPAELSLDAPAAASLAGDEPAIA